LLVKCKGFVKGSKQIRA